MSPVAELAAGMGSVRRSGLARAVLTAMCVFALSGLAVGCSSALSTVPEAVSEQVQMMPVVTPVSLAAPQEIVVPMPVPAAPRLASTPMNERRNGAIKIGRPYAVAGNWYYPAPGAGYDEEGVASWYGPDFQGKSTANGETYNMNRLTAAHPTLPMPCYVSVTNIDNGRTIVVRINDRGPYKAGRIIDLSHRAAQLLAVTRSGTAHVRVRYLRMAPLMADERFEEQFLSRQPWHHGPQLASVGLRGTVTNWLPAVAASQ